MLTRRVFLHNGALALVSLGFAPSFLARTVERRRHPEEGARRDLPARRRRRPEHGRALRRAGVLRRPAGHRDRAARPRRRRDRPRRLLRPAPAARRPEAALRRAAARDRPRCGSPDTTRSHFDAQDYMESATPGVKSTADGWLNRYLQANAADAPSRHRSAPWRWRPSCRAPAGTGPGARAEPADAVRRAARANGGRHGAGASTASTQRRPTPSCTPPAARRSTRSGNCERRTRSSTSRPAAPTIRDRRSARR